MRKFGLKDKFSYMMGDVGCNMVLSLANSYLLVFYTKVMGVSAAVVGTIFMLARFVDAVTDMTVGRIVDAHVGKNGDRYRPWLAYASLPLAIMSALMYNALLANAAMGVKIAYLIVTYLLFGSVCYTAVNIPYGAMSSVITSDSKERASLSTWRSVGSTIGGAALGIIIPLVIYTKDAAGNSVANGSRFFVTAVVLSVLSFLCIMVCYRGAIERVRIPNAEKQQKDSLGANLTAIGACLKDKAVLFNVIYCVFIYASTTTFTTFNAYMFLDYFGSASMSGLASLVMMFGMLLSAPVASIFAKRIGKKELSVIGLGISTLVYALLFVVRINSAMLYFVAVFFAFFGLGLVTMVSYALTNDCIDNYFLNTGVSAGGTVYALNSFMRKLAGAVMTGLGGWGLSWIGYNELAVTQTAAVKNGVYTLGIGLPALCFIVSLVFMLLFPLNKKRIEENTVKMEALRADKQN